jgi:acetyltransferase-like isoleucine patch superfamily enzyme
VNQIKPLKTGFLRRLARLVLNAIQVIRSEAVLWFRSMLRSIPGEVGCWFRKRFYGFHSGARTRVLTSVIIHYPEGLLIGNDVGIADGCQLNAAGGIEIGDAVFIGPSVIIWSQNHAYERCDLRIMDQGYERSKVTIEDDVWIGAGAIILPGVRLSRGTVVAAGAVVTRTTDAYAIVGGVPARPLGSRSSIV